jgi:hypothetical protein
MKPEKARRVLMEGTDLLEELGIRYWLGAGTALGAYRDNLSDAFLEHDTDIDVCTLDEMAIWKFSYAALRRGWMTNVIYSVPDRWVQCMMSKDGIPFDLYLFYIDGDTCRCDTAWGTMRFPSRMVIDLEPIQIDGRPYPIPNPPWEYLDVRFGPDWRTPAKKKIDWFEEAANLERYEVPRLQFKTKMIEV